MNIETLRSRIKTVKAKDSRPRFSSEIRSQTIIAFRASGMSAAVFAKDIGISQGSLFNWLKANSSDAAKSFRKLSIEPEAQRWTVHGPKGLRIEGLNLSALAQLIDHLEAI